MNGKQQTFLLQSPPAWSQGGVLIHKTDSQAFHALTNRQDLYNPQGIYLPYLKFERLIVYSELFGDRDNLKAVQGDPKITVYWLLLCPNRSVSKGSAQASLTWRTLQDGLV